MPNPCVHICVDHGQYYACECHSGYTGRSVVLTSTASAVTYLLTYSLTSVGCIPSANSVASKQNT